MICSLTGEFSNYTATFKHSDALGGEATSLIEEVQTHIGVHEFINDGYNQDKAFDFLIDSNNDSVPDFIIDSMGNDQSITNVSAEIIGMPTTEDPTVKIMLNKSSGAGWVYAAVDDPLDNEYKIKKIVRCADGKILNGRNYWLREGKIHIVDDPGLYYEITYEWEEPPTQDFFDTESPSNPYPSIPGMHNGTITPNVTIVLSKLYTYPCPGTGGHTEYAKISNKSWSIVTLPWTGYQGDWHNISFTEQFTLYDNETYNYTILTGSYPQIHHNRTLLTQNGWINCTEFVDVNGQKHEDWIPAIRLE